MDTRPTHDANEPVKREPTRRGRRAQERVLTSWRRRQAGPKPTPETGAQRLRRWVAEDRQRLMDVVRAAGLNDDKERTYKQWHCLLERHRRHGERYDEILIKA